MSACVGFTFLTCLSSPCVTCTNESYPLSFRVDRPHLPIVPVCPTRPYPLGFTFLTCLSPLSVTGINESSPLSFRVYLPHLFIVPMCHRYLRVLLSPVCRVDHPHLSIFPMYCSCQRVPLYPVEAFTFLTYYRLHV